MPEQPVEYEAQAARVNVLLARGDRFVGLHLLSSQGMFLPVVTLTDGPYAHSQVTDVDVDGTYAEALVSRSANHWRPR